MKRFVFVSMAIIVSGMALLGQGSLEGKVSYLTSQHTYVRFTSTKGLADGDTLFVAGSSGDLPVLVIKSHSSTSCVCEAIGGRTFKVGETVTGRTGAPKEGAGAEQALSEGTKASQAQIGKEAEATVNQGLPSKNREQEVHGRLALAYYTTLANQYASSRQRMRYTFSMAANNLGNSKLSLETYVSFVHSNNNWNEIKNNIFEGLKIYNLAARYQFSESTMLLAGRKVNARLSSVGAIDGLQVEQKFGSLIAGLIVGSRPDYSDYSIDPSLFQYGAYLGHELNGNRGKMQNTLAYIEQMNGGMTDRRFVYFQHTNNLITNLYFFGSVEADLYQKVDNEPQTVFKLYNTYLLLRYRIIRPLSVSLSYSARNNLIYYESYKDFIDRLLENEALQGWRARVSYRPVKLLYLGVNAGYRYRKDDPIPTKNLHGYATYTRVPGIGGSATATVTWLNSAYLDGMIYGLGLNRDLFSGKLYAGLNYHYVDYFYRSNEQDLVQHVGEASLSWSVYRKLSLSVHYEGTFEKSMDYHRLYLNLSQRF